MKMARKTIIKCLGLCLLFLVLLPAFSFAQFTGSNPEEPPVIGPGTVGDPNTGFTVNLPDPIVYPNPPVPGIRTLIYVFAGSNPVKNGDPRGSPYNNQLCQNLTGTGLDPLSIDGCEQWPLGGSAVKLYYRYKKCDLDQPDPCGYSGQRWLPANTTDDALAWDGAAVLSLRKMFNADGTPADIFGDVPASPHDFAPMVPFANLKPEEITALRPFVWVGVFPDLPSGTLIQYRVEAKDNNQFYGHNSANIDPATLVPPFNLSNSKGILLYSNISIDSKGRPTASDAGNPLIMKNKNYWNLIADDPTDMASDPWPEILTPYSGPDVFYEGKHVHHDHHPVRVKIALSDPRLKTFCPKLVPQLQFGDIGGGCGLAGGACTSDANCTAGYTCDKTTGKCNQTCSNNPTNPVPCSTGNVCTGGSCAKSCTGPVGTQSNCPTGNLCQSVKEDYTGAMQNACVDTSGGPKDNQCFVWVYPCNICQPRGPNGIAESGGGDDNLDTQCLKDDLGDPIAKRNATNKYYSINPCTQDAELPGCKSPDPVAGPDDCSPRTLGMDGGVWNYVNGLTAATRMNQLPQRLRDALLGDHGKPARCHDRTVHTLSNPQGLDLRKAYAALSSDGSRFVIRFDADNVPDQDTGDPKNCSSKEQAGFFGQVGDLLNLGLGLLSGKVFYVNIWVVRINNPKSSDKDIGEDGYLLYLPMLYDLLHSGLGSASSILQSLACTLDKLAITSAKAHLLPDLAGLLSTDPSVMSPINAITNCQDKIIDTTNNYIVFTLDTNSDGWQKFIKPNPHGRLQITVQTMVMPLSLGVGESNGIVLSIPSDFTKLIGVPQPVDTTNEANFYYRPIQQVSVASDTTAPAVKVADASSPGGYKDMVSYTSVTSDGACTAYNGGTCVTDRNTYYEVSYYQTTVYDPKTATFSTDYRLPKVKLTFKHLKENLATTQPDPMHPITDAALKFFRNTDNTKIISHFMSVIPGYKIDFDPDGTLGGIVEGGYNMYRRYSVCNPCPSCNPVITCDPTDNAQWGGWSSWALLNNDINGNEQWKWTYGTDANVVYRSIEDDPVYFPVENFCDPTYQTCLQGCAGNAACISTCNSQYTDCQNQYVNQRGENRPKRKEKEPQDLLNASSPNCYMWFVSRRADGKTVWKRKQSTCSVTPIGNDVQGIFSDADRYDDVRYLLSTNAALSHNDPMQTMVPSNSSKYYRYQYMVTAADKPNLYCVHRNGVKVFPTGDSTTAHNDTDGANEFYKNTATLDQLDPSVYDLDIYACPYVSPTGCPSPGHPVDLSHTLTLKYGTTISINDGAPLTLTNTTTSTNVTIVHNSPDTQHATFKGVHLVTGGGCDPTVTTKGVIDDFPAYNETPQNLGVISKIVFVKPKPGPSPSSFYDYDGDPRAADVNDDGEVNNDDFELIRSAFGAKLGDPKYNLKYDFNGDGIINMKDLVVILKTLKGKQRMLVPPK